MDKVGGGGTRPGTIEPNGKVVADKATVGGGGKYGDGSGTGAGTKREEYKGLVV